MCTRDNCACQHLGPKLTIPVILGKWHLEVRVDLGCGQTLVCWWLIPAPDQIRGQISLCCIDGNKEVYPTAQVTLMVVRLTRGMHMGVAPVLPYPWPGFHQVMQTVSCQGTPTQTVLEGDNPDDMEVETEEPEGDTPDNMEMELGEPGLGPPKDQTARDNGTPIPPNGADIWLDMATDFCQDQRDDPTLKHAYEQLSCMDGVMVDAQSANQ
ncbi:unnamed protein product [Caretta caretta]